MAAVSVLGPCLLFVVALFGRSAVLARPPHIIFIVADDLGWNDVGWHNPAMITPNLDKLARQGVILNSSYVQPVCTPSRSAFMTGFYPFHTGLQHGVIYPPVPTGLPRNLTTLPQKLKQLGYNTHMIGKWHLGFCDWGYTPTRRGFDTFFGYYIGAEDYYEHTRAFGVGVNGVDFRDNESPDGKYNGTYSAYAFSKRAEDILSSSDPNGDPLFMYLPFQSVHEPLQVPEKYSNMYLNIQHIKRRTYCGMVSALDEAVGNITSALERHGFMNNSIIIFTTDNGGPTYAGSNNLPLRGAKTTLWEGGTKGAAFVYSQNHLSRKGYTSTGMMHAVDWFPTILSAAGGTPDTQLDGKDQWAMLSTGSPSTRQEFVYNIDPIIPNAAIRIKDYKLIVGDPGLYSGWYPLPTIDELGPCPPENADMAALRNIQMQNQTRLYNIVVDPTEHFDISQQAPAVVQQMLVRLDEYMKTMVTPRTPAASAKSNPNNFGGFWSPGWC